MTIRSEAVAFQREFYPDASKPPQHTRDFRGMSYRTKTNLKGYNTTDPEENAVGLKNIERIKTWFADQGWKIVGEEKDFFEDSISLEFVNAKQTVECWVFIPDISDKFIARDEFADDDDELRIGAFFHRHVKEQ